MRGPGAFVGREDELSRLVGVLGGGARLVLVTGDAGVGKTRFVGEGMARAVAGAWWRCGGSACRWLGRWYLAHAPAGDQFVAYMETPDFGRALSLFSASRDEFDLWFKRRLTDATGLDLNTPPSGPLPELLSSYSA
jgi:AAA ATPase domain